MPAAGLGGRDGTAARPTAMQQAEGRDSVQQTVPEELLQVVLSVERIMHKCYDQRFPPRGTHPEALELRAANWLHDLVGVYTFNGLEESGLEESHQEYNEVLWQVLLMHALVPRASIVMLHPLLPFHILCRSLCALPLTC